MKTFSDYQGEEALDLWMDLLDPITEIMGDENLREMRKQEGVKIGHIAKALVKNHKKEVAEILLRIDPEPLDGLNIITRLIALLRNLSSAVKVSDFFDASEDLQKTLDASAGPATETTGASET